MFRCPNCGLKASGDYCQWCHYPILRGVPKRGRKSKKQEAAEARERAQREAVEAKEAEVVPPTRVITSKAANRLERH